MQWAQVGVNLLMQSTRQEAQVFTGLHCGASQNNAFDLLILQRSNSLGHGQEGLARTGEADTENNVIAVDGIDVVLLPLGLGPHGLATMCHDAATEHLAGGLLPAIHNAHRVPHRLRGELMPTTGHCL